MAQSPLSTVEEWQRKQSGADDDVLANDLIDNEGEKAKEPILHPTNTPKDTPDTVKVEKRKVSSRNVSKTVQYNASQAEIDGEQRNLSTNDLIDNEGEEEEDIDHPTDTTKDTPDTGKVEKRRRPSRNVSKPVEYNDSMEDSDGDGDPPMKKSTTDSMVKANNKRRSFKGDDETEDVSKRIRVSKKNDTELGCPECEFRTLSVQSWVSHLRRIHSTTPALAGLALLCECGHESLKRDHSLLCNHHNTTVIRKREGPIQRLDDAKTTPQCVLCEMYPRTTRGYVHHLRVHHKSTLIQCSCGLEVRSDTAYKHHEECNTRQFTLHKLNYA